jgi:protein-S-isoprenylcysteine O-methyltransferase Ste14
VTNTAVRQHAFQDLIQTTLVRALFLFLPAWTLDWPLAWALLGVLFVGELGSRIYLLRHDPAMIDRRRNVKVDAEDRDAQKFAQAAVRLIYCGMLLVCALDHRYDWTSVSTPVCVAGLALSGVSVYVIFLAMRANTFASVTVELHEGHRVITTGPYALVRHPMYSGLILLVFGAPLALGSWWGLIGGVLFCLVIQGRMVDEEKFLSESLPGYREYLQRTRNRVVPLAW